MVIVLEMESVLAKLHRTFRECEAQAKFWNNSLLKKFIEGHKFNDISKGLKKLYDKQLVQLIPRNVQLGNFLLRISAYTKYCTGVSCNVWL